MALSHKVSASTTASPTTTTSVAPGLAVPDNCISVLIVNTGTNTLLVSDAGVAAGTVLAVGTNAFPLLPGAGLNIGPIGTLETRGTLVYSYGASGGATSASILYTNQLGAG